MENQEDMLLEDMSEFTIEAARDMMRKALKRIERAEDWIQGVAARDYEGVPVNASNPQACKFCSIGALHADHDGSHYEDIRNAAYALLAKQTDSAPYLSSFSKIINWNDAAVRTHGEVVAAFKAAIEGGNE